MTIGSTTSEITTTTKTSSEVSRGSGFMTTATIAARGEGLYGKEHNSTILSADQAAAAVGIRPLAKVPAVVWKYAIRTHAALLPVLHWRDAYRPPDSQKSLMCLWWKALIALDLTRDAATGTAATTASLTTTTTTQSSSFVIPNDTQHQLAYQLLPPLSRWILKVGHPFFPRLHHANLEIRTVFLNRAIGRLVHDIRQRDNHDDTTTKTTTRTRKIRFIYLGAGYDVRSIYLQQQGLIDEAVELDLPMVIEAKSKLFSSPRFTKYSGSTPKLIPVDLNQLDSVQQILQDIFLQDSVDNDGDDGDDNQSNCYYNIILFEGVMIYLQPGVPHGLLQVCSDALRHGDHQGSLCFADRLENIPGGDESLARKELASTGWNLVEWLSKPGLARRSTHGCGRISHLTNIIINNSSNSKCNYCLAVVTRIMMIVTATTRFVSNRLITLFSGSEL